MEFNQILSDLRAWEPFASLPDSQKGLLLVHASEVVLAPNGTLYSEGHGYDGTFCILLSGNILVSVAGTLRCTLPPICFLGEIAPYHRNQVRTATVQTDALGATLLRVELSADALKNGLPQLYSRFANIAYETLIADSQQT